MRQFSLIGESGCTLSSSIFFEAMTMKQKAKRNRQIRQHNKTSQKRNIFDVAIIQAQSQVNL